jgi:branched-chain amino acid transport system ATP-binding protein
LAGGDRVSDAKLKINDIHLSFKGVKSLNGVSIEVKPRTLHSIIGPNGAGKSALINCISGFYKPQSGEIWFKEKNLLLKEPHQLANLGISRTFQNIELFSKLTVLDNLMLGRHKFMKTGVIISGIYWGKALKQEKANREKLSDLISLLNLEEILNQEVGVLPYGLQKRVELGRALAADPDLLLLDEPVAGMNGKEKEEIVYYINKVKDQLGLTIILVEHDMKMVMGISDIISVLNFGEKIAEGTPREIQNDDNVIKAYLGTPNFKSEVH